MTRAAARLGLVVGAVAVAVAIGLAAASRSGSAPVEGPVEAPGGLSATLEDQIQHLPGKRIRWSTTWVLRWTPPPGSVGYDLQTVTSEGPSERLRRVTEPQFRIKVAGGENLEAEGLRRRDLQLALAVGQVSYRVRSVSPGGVMGPWSRALAAGESLALEGLKTPR